LERTQIKMADMQLHNLVVTRKISEKNSISSVNMYTSFH
jgi:hypothetical protein